jgi:GTP-binding protein EngB required for normal cell division
LEFFWFLPGQLREGIAVAGLNENHKRRILSTLEYADRSLGECLHVLAPSSRSIFSRYIGDISPAQYHWVEDYAEKIREQMGRLLERFKIDRNPSTTLLSWKLRTSLITLDIALEDMYPEQMRGYGEMDTSAAGDLSWTIQEMRRLVSQLQAFLSETPDADGTLQIPGLAESSLGNLLDRIGRIIARHGLIEFLTSLNTIIRKVESHRYEVAVFGRVSCGKSSLINRLLEIDLLPVGTTPITAVPIHITAGIEQRLRVSFLDRRQDLPVARLAEFATEQENPANTKRVVALEVEVPSRRLLEGVAFVDTPGIASLATTGTQLSYAYLPDSDLGLVLVDGNSTLGREDLDLLRSLHAAGIPSKVMISKCDLLSRPDLDKVLAYTRGVISEHLGFTMDVIPVSSVESWESRVDGWFEDILSPLLKRSRESLEASLNRKAQSLRESLLAALEAKASLPGAEIRETLDIERIVRPVDEGLEQFKQRCDQQLDGVTDWTEEVLNEASFTMARLASGSNEREVLSSTSVREQVIRTVASRCHPLLQEYEELAERVTNVLRELKGRASAGGAAEAFDIPRPSALPSPVVSLLDGITIPQPGLLARISQSARIRHFRKELGDKAGIQVQQVLQEFRTRLEHWFRATVSAIEESYRAQTDPLRYQSSPSASEQSTGGQDGLREDIEFLRDYESGGNAYAVPVVSSSIVAKCGVSGDVGLPAAPDHNNLEG